jgi:hypothetical protein
LEIWLWRAKRAEAERSDPALVENAEIKLPPEPLGRIFEADPLGAGLLGLHTYHTRLLWGNVRLEGLK